MNAEAESTQGQFPEATKKREEKQLLLKYTHGNCEEEYFPYFKKLFPLHFPGSQFQRNFNCKENFVTSLEGKGSVASTVMLDADSSPNWGFSRFGCVEAVWGLGGVEGGVG